MPVYEFSCPECGARFDDLLPLGAPEPSCPRCGATRVDRLISMFAAGTGETGGGGCACGGACACGRR